MSFLFPIDVTQLLLVCCIFPPLPLSTLFLIFLHTFLFQAFSNDTTNIYRESQIGTVNYMAPEAIAPYAPDDHMDNEHHTGTGHNNNQNHGTMSMRLGRASDVWSLGCILYQMVYGRPPFAALTTIQKLHAIPNPKFGISYPDQGNGHAVDPDAVGSIQVSQMALQ